MATFVRDESAGDDEEQAWRKCWVCGVNVYRAKDKYQADMAPEDAWVEVNFGSGVVVSWAMAPLTTVRGQV